MGRRIKAIAALVIAAAILISMITVVLPSTSVVFNGKLTLVSQGTSTYTVNNTTITREYVDFSINYNIPFRLDPNRLNFTLTKQSGNFAVPFQNGSVSRDVVNLEYSTGWYPHIITRYSVNGLPVISTIYYGEIYNPNKLEVGGNLSNWTNNGVEPYIISGAILNLTLGNTPLGGLIITMNYNGAYGSSSFTFS